MIDYTTRTANDSAVDSLRHYMLPRHFMYAEMVVFSLFGILVIFAWVPALMSLFAYGGVLPSAMRAAIFLNLTAASILLFSLFIRRELRRTGFTLTGTELVFHSPARKKRISLATLRTVSLIPFPGNAGVVAVESGSDVMTIPLMLENSTDLFSRLEQICTATPACSVASDTWARIQRICFCAEAAGRRVATLHGALFALIGAVLPATVFIGALFWNMSIIPLIVWSVAGVLTIIGAYSAADIQIRRHDATRGGVQLNGGLSGEEATIYVRTGLLFFLLYLLAAIFYKAMIL